MNKPKRKTNFIAIYVLSLYLLIGNTSCKNEEQIRPNILWIYVEDISANLGCYGDSLVQTPNIDKLAEDGVRFTNTIMPAPVSSPCRSAIITGMMQTSLGLHNHHSSRTEETAIYLPDSVNTIPELFKDAGYFTFNSGKDDYNFWYNREDLYTGEYWTHPLYGNFGEKKEWFATKENEPFFGQIQLYGNKQVYMDNFKQVVKNPVDREKIVLPPYYPEHPMIRDEWGQYLDAINITDNDVAEIIEKLNNEGVLNNTIIFFISDHGMRAMRHKQFLYESGVNVPFIVTSYCKDKKIEGSKVREDLISGIDIGTTSLALAEISIPEYMEGMDFFDKSYNRDYVISGRDRCDYTIDHIRSVRTDKYKYIRNFMTDRSYMQPNYRDEWESTQLLRRMYEEGKMNEIQSRYFDSFRPEEELYDLEKDPFEISNLADSPEYKDILKNHRKILNDWITKTDDKGQYPEDLKGLGYMYEIWGDSCVNPEYDEIKKMKVENKK